MSTDLFGHPIADPPPMSAPLPWRVFRINHITEWVMARTEREAILFYVEFSNELGDTRTEDEMRASRHIDDVHELTDAELQSEEYDDQNYTSERGLTFADVLASMSARATVPNYFATTEY